MSLVWRLWLSFHPSCLKSIFSLSSLGEGKGLFQSTVGPDGFKNLYNDPEKSEFKLDHTAPNTDAKYDL